MDWLTHAEFDQVAEAYDLAVDQTGELGTIEHPEIDIACSSTDWVRPALDVFAADAEPWILRSDAGFIVLTKTAGHDENTALVPPESMWGFASPLISAHPEVLVTHLSKALDHDDSWDLVILTGLAPGGRIETAVRSVLHGQFALYSGPEMTRCRIDLPTFHARETSKKRRERRRIANRCGEQGVEVIDPLADPNVSADSLFTRILQVEAQSWKGLKGSGIIEPTLQKFYRKMVGSLPRTRIRLLFARKDDRDIGYILGHVRGDEYRGLQISYTQPHQHLSIGSLLQSAEIDRAAASGVRTYDLGMDMAYKQRWSTHTFTTRTTAIGR